MLEQRVFSSLPKVFQNDLNKRLLGSTADVFFEPNQFEKLEGHIGDDTGMSENELDRLPFISNRDISDPNYQLSPCVVSYDESGTVIGGAFFSDLIGHIESNGGLTNDLNRLFECDYFAFNPPIDIDKWVNFSKYIWTGEGDVKSQAFYKVKEPTTSHVCIHTIQQDGTLLKRDVISDTAGFLTPNSAYAPDAGNTIGDLREDATDINRVIYEWDGSKWLVLNFTALGCGKDLPSDATVGQSFYFCLVGILYQRPLFYQYSRTAQRWIAKTPIISLPEPQNPIEGCIWEKVTEPNRKFYVFKNGEWENLIYDFTNTMDGIGVPETEKYVYITNNNTDDPWSKENWWIHYNDLCGQDKNRFTYQQSSRPIIELWGGIESFALNEDIDLYKLNKSLLKTRNPRFESFVYYNNTISSLAELPLDAPYNGSSIFRYAINNANSQDAILGFSPDYDESGELKFDLTLESHKHFVNNTEIKGYKFFQDAFTNLKHGVWTKSSEPLIINDIKNVPINLSNNPDHETLTTISRRNIVDHYRSILTANSIGVGLGNNNYRWTDRNPVNGANIVDSEGSLLLPLSILQNSSFDFVEATRIITTEYNKFHRRFRKRLTNMWNSGVYSTPDDQLSSTVVELVDAALSEMFIYGDSSTPFWRSDMGTFVNANTQEVMPIMIPPSAAKTGTVQPHTPILFKENGVTKLLCHDGSITQGFNDARDNALLNLELRFFNSITSKKITETVEDSAFLNKHQFTLKRFVGNRTISTNVPPVDQIVNTVNDIISPTFGLRVYSKVNNSYAIFETGWSFLKANAGDIFEFDNNHYVYNGIELKLIPNYNRPNTFDYSINEYNSVIRRDFERWYIDSQLNPIDNIDYNENDPWTWNYSSSGLEGGWAGLYKRIYGTVRPHITPWECFGFTVKPTWWDTVYTPNDEDEFGNSIYYSNNAMWNDFKNPTLARNANIAISNDLLWNQDTPIPVDSNGALISPVASGLLDENLLTNKDAPWAYGDGNTVEKEFSESTFGKFAEAIAGYLLKPARFTEFLWSDYTFTIGEKENSLAGGTIEVNDKTFRRNRLKDVKVHNEDGVYVDTGINSWISEALNLSGKSIKDFGDNIRNSTISLGWKTNGFIEQKSTIIKTPSGIEIPFEDLKLTVHVGIPRKNVFHSGIQIIKRGDKYQIFGYNYSDPVFTVNYSSRPTIGGQVVLEETFTYQDNNTFTLTKFKVGKNDISRFAVLIEGYKVDPRFIQINSNQITIFDPALKKGDQVTAQIITTKSNSSTRVKSFKTGNQEYFYYDSPSNNYISYPYGHLFNSPQEVVEMLADHGHYMNELGWVYERDDWLSLATRFAQWSQSAGNNEIFVDVPSGNKLKFKHTRGIVSTVGQKNYGGYNLLDIAAMPIREFNTFKLDDYTKVESSELIFGLRMYVQDVQHAVFISNRTRFNDLIYEPFTGLRQKRLLVQTFRTKKWNGKFETPGAITFGQTVLPNFEKRTKDITKYYNNYDLVSDTDLRNRALDLYGWYYKDYMRGMNINDIMAFNYHKSAIREKGTIRPIIAFANSKQNRTPIELMECWAWKVGDFGKNSYDNDIRFTIDANELNSRIQKVYFSDVPETFGIQVPSFNKNNTGRWIVPPKKNNFEFPINTSTSYDVRILALENEEVMAKMFEFDPADGKFDPLAYSQIDIETSFDPAYYGTDGLQWGESKIGTIWWDTTNRAYTNYKNKLPNEWGKLDYIKILNTVKDGTMFVSTLESVPNYQDNQRITIKSNDGSKFDGVILEIDENVISYELMIGPESASVLSKSIVLDSLVEMTTNEIEIYEWIKSRVPPSLYQEENDDVQVYNPIDPEFTEISDEGGKSTYYFWVKNRRNPINNKNLSSFEIAFRIENPTSNLLPWYGVVDNKSFVFNASALTKRSNASLQIFTYPENHIDHDQWALVVENDKRAYLNDDVLGNIVSSLEGSDAAGKLVPAPFRTQLDQYGTGIGQTVFKDLTEARRVFLDSLNTLLKKYNRFTNTGYNRAFPSTFKDDWWTDTDYDILGYAPTQKVRSINELDQIIDVLENDVVQVTHAFQIQNVKHYETYQFIDNRWKLVQTYNGSVKVTSGIFEDFANNVRRIKDIFTIEDFNSLIFDMINESIRQFEICEWCFKTSYIDVITTTLTGQPGTKPANETENILNNVLDMKPYHTKLRRFVSSHVLQNGDDEFDEAVLAITDKMESKTSIFIDRLSCNLFDDNTFDTESFDTMPFDYQTWDRPSLGVNDFVQIGTIDTNVRTTTFFIGKTFPYLEHILKGFLPDGNPAIVPLYRIYIDNEDLYIIFDTLPPSGITINVLRNTGAATQQLLDGTQIDDKFRSVQSTYKHAIAITGTTCNDLTGCDPCDSLDGGNPEERARLEILDHSYMNVKTEFTPAYGGFDGTPFDTAPFDTQIAETSTAEWNLFINNDYQTQTLTETISLGQHFDVSNPQINSLYCFTNGRYTIGEVKIRNNGTWINAIEGEDFEYTDFYRSIKTLRAFVPDETALRLFARSVKLKSSNYRITNTSITNYSIDLDTIIIDQTFAFNATIQVEYYENEVLSNRSGLEIFNRFFTSVNYNQDHLTLGEIWTGCSVLNGTTIYTWNGEAWISSSTSNGDKVFVVFEQRMLERVGAAWNEVYSVGDGVDNLSYKFEGLSSSTTLGYSSFGQNLNEGGWAVSQNIIPDGNIIAWWSYNSIKALGTSNEVYTWNDVSGNHHNLTNLDTPPVLDLQTKLIKFDTNTNFTSPTLDSSSGIAMVFLVRELQDNFIINGSNFSLEITPPSDNGDFSMALTQKRATENSLYLISNNNLAFHNEVYLQITNLNSNPVVKINGITISINNTVIGSGNINQNQTQLEIGNAKVDVFSILLME